MRRRRRGERGSALVELTWLGILLLVPLIWIVLSVFEVQRGAFATVPPPGPPVAPTRSPRPTPRDTPGPRPPPARRWPTRAPTASRSRCASPAGRPRYCHRAAP